MLCTEIYYIILLNLRHACGLLGYLGDLCFQFPLAISAVAVIAGSNPTSFPGSPRERRFKFKGAHFEETFKFVFKCRSVKVFYYILNSLCNYALKTSINMDDMRILKAKLLQSEAENQRLREQLHGLISLVKK